MNKNGTVADSGYRVYSSKRHSRSAVEAWPRQTFCFISDFIALFNSILELGWQLYVLSFRNTIILKYSKAYLAIITTRQAPLPRYEAPSSCGWGGGGSTPGTTYSLDVLFQGQILKLPIFSTFICNYFANDNRYGTSYYWQWMESYLWAFEWHIYVDFAHSKSEGQGHAHFELNILEMMTYRVKITMAIK